MLNDMMELAENKLLILYIFEKFDSPISHSNLSEIVLKNNLLNYFQFQQYLYELIEGGFLNDIKDGNKQIISITQRGKNTLEFFKSRISDKKKLIIDSYFISNPVKTKKEIKTTCDCMPYPDGRYMVNLKLFEDNSLLIELNITAYTKEQCDKICTSFNENPRKLYGRVMSSLLN